MAKNKVEVDILIDDKGNLRKVARDANKAGVGLDKASKSSDNYSKKQKGVAGATSNSTKAFAKMAGGTGGLVAAYATLAANIFAISAAFQFLKGAGDLRVLQESQFNYSVKTGKSLSILTSRVQEATGGLLAFEEAAQAVSIGTAAGLSNNQIEGLASVAKKASMALGRDLTDSFNRLTRGAIKAEPELLDELGIIIRLEKASKDYAQALGKNAKDLTTFQKSQAVVNAVLAQGEEKFSDLGGSVNEIARLGKAFNDVILSIKETVGPFVEFIGGVFADNVYALAGAFAFLGTGITRSLAGAGPAMLDISEQSSLARQQLQGAAGTSVVGKKLATDPSSLSDKDLTYIESSARAKSSTIIKYDNISKEAVVRNVRIIKAERALDLAQTQTGVKRTYALWRAELKLLQAQHGTTMGFMKAGMRGFGRVANSVLGAAGAIGLLFTLIGLLKEFMDSLKSPEFKAFMQDNKALQDILRTQNAEQTKLLNKFELSANAAERISQSFELLSNLRVPEGLQLFTIDKSTRAGNMALSDQVKQNLEALESAKLLAETITTQIKSYEKAGMKAPEAMITQLTTLSEGIEKMEGFGSGIARQLGNGTVSAKEYNGTIEQINNSMNGFVDINKKGTKELTAQQHALMSFAQTGEELVQLQRKMGEAPSKYSNALKVLADLGTGLADSGLTDITDLTKELQGTIKDLLGDEHTLKTLAEVRTAIEEKTLQIVKAEKNVLLAQVRLKTKYINLTRGATALQTAALGRQQKVAELEAARNKLLGDRTVAEVLRAQFSNTKTKQDKEQLLLLEAQLRTAKELTNEGHQLEMAFRNAFESSMTTNIADLIKGNESSLKDAMLKIAQAALSAVADKMAEHLSLKISDFIFGSPTDPAVVAQKDNTVATRELTTAITKIGTVPSVPSVTETATSTALGKTGTAVVENIVGGSEITEVVTTGAKKAVIPFVSAFGDFFANFKSQEVSFGTSLKGLFTDIGADFKGIFSGLGSMLSGLFGGGEGESGFLSSALKFGASLFGFGGAPGARTGGIMSSAGKVAGYATGGVARGPGAGYPAVLHGTEAVVPLPNGRSIPVEMSNGGQQQNNVVVNVSTDGTARTSDSTGPDMESLGAAIARAVQQELQAQKRSGGILSPYGAA